MCRVRAHLASVPEHKDGLRAGRLSQESTFHGLFESWAGELKNKTVRKTLVGSARPHSPWLPRLHLPSTSGILLREENVLCKDSDTIFLSRSFSFLYFFNKYS